MQDDDILLPELQGTKDVITICIYAWKKEGVYEVLMQNILFPEFQGTKDIITIYICMERRSV